LEHDHAKQTQFAPDLLEGAPAAGAGSAAAGGDERAKQSQFDLVSMEGKHFAEKEL